jgi:uncharacterized protein (TIGR00269 family)
MPRCRRCGEPRVEVKLDYARARLCSRCFTDYFVERVRRTVQEYRMFGERARVGVALSGGKDSGALLHSLRQAFPHLDLVALHVDLGIQGYSDHCRGVAEQVARMAGAEFRVLTLRDKYGFTIDDYKKTLYRRKMCAVCGVVKRYLFDRMAEEADIDVLATGHNLDDMVGTMLTTFFAGDFTQLIKLKPVLPPLTPRQRPKVKPLIKSPEFEDLLYCLHQEIPFRRVSCPHARGTHSQESKRLIEALAQGNPGFRYQALSLFLKKLIPLLEPQVTKPPLTTCQRCGAPSSTPICSFCRRVALVHSTQLREEAANPSPKRGP